MGIKKFAGSLALQLISCASALLREVDPMESVTSVDLNDEVSPVSDLTNKSQFSDSKISEETVSSLNALTDANNKIHRLCCLPKKDGDKGATMTRKCKICHESGVRHDVKYFCYDCGMNYSYCSPDLFNKTRDCFSEHVRRIKKELPKRTREKRKAVE